MDFVGIKRMNRGTVDVCGSRQSARVQVDKLVC